MSNRPQKGKQRSARRNPAWAPYNFIPLPDKPLRAKPVDPDEAVEYWLTEDDGQKPVRPRHDQFIAQRHSGYFDVQLTTVTPTYVRGMLETQDAVENKQHETDKDWQQHENAGFFTRPDRRAAIPGSSLRGMLRNLTEIITFSKLHFVSDSQKMFFRAVAAERSDPLQRPYQEAIGKFSRNVRAGYLVKRGTKWSIQPAQGIGRDKYGKVKDKLKGGGSPVKDVRGIKRFNDREYEVGYYDVGWEAGRRGLITRVFTPPQNYNGPIGVLVCSGNMIETQAKQGGKIDSPRKNYALVGPPDGNAKEIAIPEQVIRDHITGLSPFQAGNEDQTKRVFSKENGMLQHGRPVFYIMEGNQVTGIGHTPNFRVAPLVWDEDGPHAVSPLDRVPPQLRGDNDSVTDMAEVLFGFVREKRADNNSDDSYAGRLTVSDALLDARHNDQNIYTETFAPHILGSPKPTTFQHYLEQPRGHDTPQPNLHHYGSNAAQVRGHKLYWRQHVTSIEDVRDSEFEKLGQPDTQHTRITAVKPEVTFNFQVHFTNLSDAELGALSWVLALGDDPEAFHMIGMGKPLGLGVVELRPTLHLIDRQARYETLFTEDGAWHEAQRIAEPEEVADYIARFKGYLHDTIGIDFDSAPRIHELRTMLRARERSRDFAYMQIENGRNGSNDYAGRPVLPKPSVVVGEPQK